MAQDSATGALLDALRFQLRSDQLSVQKTERMIYSRDLWPLQTIRLSAGRLPPLPGVIVWPRSEADVLHILSVARRFHVPITPYGGGSGVLGGAMASPGAIIMDMKRMNRILEISERSATLEVEPGILGQHLEDKLNEKGYTLGHFPSSLMTASVGGYLATRSAGQYSSRYGKIEDMTLSIRFVDGLGHVIDTAGDELREGAPDLKQLILGCEGTLGVVTSARLKIHPLPAARAWRGIRFGSVGAGLATMRAIMQEGLRPSVLRLYDEIDTLLVGKGDDPLEGAVGGSGAARGHGPGLLGRFPGVARQAVRLALGRPALLESLGKRILPHEVLLIIGFEGGEEEVEASMPAAVALARSVGGVDLGAGPGLKWFEKRYDVSFKMPTFFHLGAFVDTCEVAATWSRILPLYHAVRAAASPHVLVMAHFSHAYPEGASIYFSIGGRADGQEDAERRYRAAWQAILDVTRHHGGTISHHHGVGRWKAPWATREHADFLDRYRMLKAAFDPMNILNPGKLYVLD